MTKTLRSLSVLALCLMVLAACNRSGREAETETLPLEELYAKSKSALDNGNMDRAERYYRRLVARFPYGRYSEQAQIELAYAQYKRRRYDEAISTLNRFIKTYPTHETVDYAYYLRGLTNFERDGGIIERYLKQDLTKRDQGNARRSFNDFSELLRKFPNSRYAADARQRMVYLRNGLAASEQHIAEYYLRRKVYIGAINRARYVLENYPQSEYIPEALAVMTESYTQLGESGLAADTRRVLELNFPNHPYLRGEWKPDRDGVWDRLFPG